MLIFPTFGELRTLKCSFYNGFVWFCRGNAHDGHDDDVFLAGWGSFEASNFFLLVFSKKKYTKNVVF